jgi:predicted amidophosphoribosyltransferase
MTTTFSELCADLKVTPDERVKLAQHLASMRHTATMALAQPPANCPNCACAWWKGNPPTCTNCGAPAAKHPQAMTSDERYEHSGRHIEAALEQEARRIAGVALPPGGQHG